MPFFKQFYTISFVIVITATIALSYMARSYIEGSIIDSMAGYNNRMLAEVFTYTIWKRHKKTLALLPCYEKRCPSTKRLRNDINTFFKELGVLRYELYFRDGEKLPLSEKDNKNEHLEDEDEKTYFASAREGKTVSFIESDYDISGEKHNVVRSFVPIIIYNKDNTKVARVKAILEITYDITNFWSNIGMVQIFAVAVVIFISFTVFGVIYYTTSKTEKLIAKQYEANIDLISEKKSAEDANRAKSQFLANISHELRTPLNAIIGFSEIIKDEVMGPLNNIRYKEYISDIHISGVHLLSLINDILDYSKAEAGKLEVEMADVDATKILKNSLRLVAPRASEADVTLIEEIPKEHYILKTDSKRLKQVVLNLLSNSVKFTPEGGTITLYAWHNMTDDKFVIEVKDNGVGIDPKDISKVMATFGQVENKLSRRYEGTGLGLPLSKRLVELMNGELEIESEIDKGTTVKITLPYIIPEESTKS